MMDSHWLCDHVCLNTDPLIVCYLYVCMSVRVSVCILTSLVHDDTLITVHSDTDVCLLTGHLNLDPAVAVLHATSIIINIIIVISTIITTPIIVIIIISTIIITVIFFAIITITTTTTFFLFTPLSPLSRSASSSPSLAFLFKYLRGSVASRYRICSLHVTSQLFA